MVIIYIQNKKEILKLTLVGDIVALVFTKRCVGGGGGLYLDRGSDSYALSCNSSNLTMLSAVTLVLYFEA